MRDGAHVDDTHRVVAPDRVFASGEAVPAAVQRIAAGLLDGVVADLRPAADADFDTGIHGARKKMKRLRAVLRLVRDEIGWTAYRNENVVLRNTARAIGGMRDARVLQDTLEHLRKNHPELLDAGPMAQTDRYLAARYEMARASITRQTLADAIVSIGSARNRYAAYPIDEIVRNDYSALAPSIRRVYRRGRRARRVSMKSRAVGDLHEWRKRVKYLRYQMESLFSVQPTLIGAQAALLDELGEMLGFDHDLAVLAALVSTEQAACADERERTRLVEAIRQQRAEVLAQAEPIGAALYVEKPKVFVERIGGYWDAWAD